MLIALLMKGHSKVTAFQKQQPNEQTNKKLSQ